MSGGAHCDSEVLLVGNHLNQGTAKWVGAPIVIQRLRSLSNRVCGGLACRHVCRDGRARPRVSEGCDWGGIGDGRGGFRDRLNPGGRCMQGQPAARLKGVLSVHRGNVVQKGGVAAPGGGGARCAVLGSATATVGDGPHG